MSKPEKKKSTLLMPVAIGVVGVLVFGTVWLFTNQPWATEAPEIDDTAVIPTTSAPPQPEETAVIEPADSSEFDVFATSEGEPIEADALPQFLANTLVRGSIEEVEAHHLEVGDSYFVRVATSDAFSARSEAQTLFSEAEFSLTNEAVGEQSSSFSFNSGDWFAQLIFDYRNGSVLYSFVPMPTVHEDHGDEGKDFH